MGMATRIAIEMRNLTQDILSSHNARMAWEAALRRETAELLKDFQAERRRDFQEMMRDIQARQRDRNREVADFLNGVRRFLNGFQRELQEAASHWRTMASTIARKRAGAR